MQEPRRHGSQNQRAQPPVLDLELIPEHQPEKNSCHQRCQRSYTACHPHRPRQQQAGQHLPVDRKSQVKLAAVFKVGGQNPTSLVFETAHHQVAGGHGLDGLICKKVDREIGQLDKTGQKIDQDGCPEQPGFQFDLPKMPQQPAPLVPARNSLVHACDYSMRVVSGYSRHYRIQQVKRQGLRSNKAYNNSK